MEPVKEGPSWAICQLGVRGYQSAAVHGDGQALRGQESTGEGHGEGWQWDQIEPGHLHRLLAGISELSGNTGEKYGTQ